MREFPLEINGHSVVLVSSMSFDHANPISCHQLVRFANWLVDSGGNSLSITGILYVRDRAGTRYLLSRLYDLVMTILLANLSWGTVCLAVLILTQMDPYVVALLLVVVLTKSANKVSASRATSQPIFQEIIGDRAWTHVYFVSPHAETDWWTTSRNPASSQGIVPAQVHSSDMAKADAREIIDSICTLHTPTSIKLQQELFDGKTPGELLNTSAGVLVARQAIVAQVRDTRKIGDFVGLLESGSSFISLHFAEHVVEVSRKAKARLENLMELSLWRAGTSTASSHSHPVLHKFISSQQSSLPSWAYEGPLTIMYACGTKAFLVSGDSSNEHKEICLNKSSDIISLSYYIVAAELWRWPSLIWRSLQVTLRYPPRAGKRRLEWRCVRDSSNELRSPADLISSRVGRPSMGIILACPCLKQGINSRNDLIKEPVQAPNNQQANPHILRNHKGDARSLYLDTKYQDLPAAVTKCLRPRCHLRQRREHLEVHLPAQVNQINCFKCVLRLIKVL
jgi:hypothetical protein